MHNINNHKQREGEGGTKESQNKESVATDIDYCGWIM